MRKLHLFTQWLRGRARVLMLRAPILVALLALTQLAAAAEIEILQFETEALNLETGAVVEIVTGLPANPDADFHFAYNSAREPHAVFIPNEFAGVEISFLDDTPFDLVSEIDIQDLTFTVEYPDQSFEYGDTVVLKTASGAYFKIGNAIEDDVSVEFDYQFLTEQLVMIDSLKAAPRPPIANPAPVANDLAPAGWQEIQSLIERDRYQIANLGGDRTPLSQNPVAENPAHQLRATFAQEFVSVASLNTGRDSWTWSLALKGYGYGEKLLEPETPDIVASGNRVEYRRGELTEWYVNDARGLEQGFILAKAPPGQGEQSLRIRLDLSGSLTAEPGTGKDEILLVAAGSGQYLQYGHLLAWDASGRNLPARMVLGDRTLTLEVDDRSAVYPVTVDPTIEYLSKYEPTDGLAYDGFAYSVSVDGDTVLVGAPHTSYWGGPYDRIVWYGVAYVFVNQNGNWVQQARLEAPDAAAYDVFGVSVSLSGETAAIGALGADGIGTNWGAAYIYVRSGDTWSLQQKILAPAYGSFGDSVALSGETVIVGAPTSKKGSARFVGTAYAFVRESGIWSLQHQFDPDCYWYTSCGGTVALSGDTAIIGKQTDSLILNGNPGYVYFRTGETWARQADLLADDRGTLDYHGYAVALSGDTAIVGAPLQSFDGAIYSGAAYIFARAGGIWTQQATLLPSDGNENHKYFGSTVSVSGDTAVVGASHLSYDTTPGAAYLYTRGAAGWSEHAKLLPDDGENGDRFGWSVSVGGEATISGAPEKNGGAFYSYLLLANQPPICASPVSVSVECDGATTTINGLDGSASSDPDDDPLSYLWTTDCPGGVFDDATGATPLLTIESTTGVCGPLFCSATLTVSDDSGEEDSCVSTIIEVQDTLAPTILAETSPMTLECAVDAYSESGVTATDVCDPDVSVVIGGDEVDTDVIGSYTRTYDAADDCGNLAAQASRMVSVADTLPPDLVVLGQSELTLECGVASYIEAGATVTDACDPDVPLVIGGDEVDTGVVGSYIRTYDATDDSGNPAEPAIRTISVADTLPPVLDVPEPTAITVTDADCSGDEPALLPVGTATDACDPDVPVSTDAPDTFPAGATTTVTYTAVDDSGNTSTAGVDVTVLFGADMTIRARKHTVGPGTYPGANKEPLVGIEVCGYDKAEGGCARTICGGINHHYYQCILDSCEPVNAGFNEVCCTTDAAGECTIDGPPGEYVFVAGDPTGTVLPDPLGGVSELTCGESKKTFLQQIVRVDGKKLPAKTSIRTGSELLIVEPEFVEWDEPEEAYPIVFDSEGEWSAEAEVTPPEGFVSDYDSLSEHVDSEVEAVQFLLTDIGSDWVPTGTRYTLEHQGRTEIVLSRIGVRLSEALAREKGLDRSGRPVAADGKPKAWHGFDPRGEWPAEIVGWIEPSGSDQTWTVKIAVSRATDLEVSITRGDGQLVEVLASNSFKPGEYSFDWSSAATAPGHYFASLAAGDLSQKVMMTGRQQ